MVLLCRLGLRLGIGLVFRVRVSINHRNIEPSEYRPITVKFNDHEQTKYGQIGDQKWSNIESNMVNKGGDICHWLSVEFCPVNLKF